MATRDRGQNPVIGDTVNLYQFVYNSNLYANADSVNGINIYYLDPALRSVSNPDGRTLIESFTSASVVNTEVGKYLLPLYLNPLLYTAVGTYMDQWSFTYRVGDLPTLRENLFKVYSDIWYTTPIPAVYDFSFYFQPNKFRHGEKKNIIIEVTANMPTATDLEVYYQNLIIGADLTVSISKRCGDCLPCEEDLKIVIEDAPVDFKDGNRGYYFLDTTDMDCGIYDIWFTLDYGNTVHISDRNQIIVYV